MNNQKQRNVATSVTVMSELVLPNDTNTHGNLMGGRLMYWMDIAGVIAAQKHCNTEVVTVSVDNISFNHPSKLGNLITIESKVTRSFHTSMEVFIKVWAEDLKSREKYLANEAYLTFVSLDSFGKPKPVPELTPETEQEKQDFDAALQRRQLRLILSGKMKLADADAIKAAIEAR